MRPLRPLLVLAGALTLSAGAPLFAQQDVPGPSEMRQGQKFPGNPLVAEGDRWYVRRQDGRTGNQASALPINRAISAYDEATRDPSYVEARWKLARALYFKGAYTGLDVDSRKAVFANARRVSEEAIGDLEKTLEQKGIKGLLDAGPEALAGMKERNEAAPTYFWAAVAWGEWALATGKIEAAKTGAAEKIRDYSSIVIGLDATFEDGGGYRILGRLHDQAPWIPFITGWVSHDDAIKYLRLAMQQSSRNFINRQFLAEALWRGNAEEKAEAIKLEEALVNDAPSPSSLIEDLKIQDDARKNLAAWKKPA
ncbi:MAG TPA: hypothetical protein VH854_00950 [Thermoanaerobaculia bacterium]|jgi:hypothetical protein|nr:hypothetical protein [Thermoanaerobaculia bacterium]